MSDPEKTRFAKNTKSIGIVFDLKFSTPSSDLTVEALLSPHDLNCLGFTKIRFKNYFQEWGFLVLIDLPPIPLLG